MFKIFGVLNKNEDEKKSREVFDELKINLKDEHTQSCTYQIQDGYIGGVFVKGCDQGQRSFFYPKEGAVLITGNPGCQKGPKNITPKQILQLYKEGGWSFLKELDGIFSIVVYAKGKKPFLLVANDKAGLFPLYYFENNQFFVFCTEAEPLVQNSHFKKYLNHDSIAEFFYFGYIFNGKTFVQEISNLPPATALQFNGKKKEQIQYFRWDRIDQKVKANRDVLSSVNGIFNRTINSFIPDGGKAYTDLTGGRDTRWIVANLRNKIPSLTALTFWNKNTDKLDITLSRRIAKLFSLRHLLIKEPSSSYFYNDYSVLKLRGVRLTEIDKHILTSEIWGKKIEIMDLLSGSYFTGLMGGEIFGGMTNGYDLATCGKSLKDIFTSGFLHHVNLHPEDVFKTEQKKINESFQRHLSLYIFLFHICRSFFNVIEGSGWERPPYTFITPGRVFPFLHSEILQTMFSSHPKLPGRAFYLALYKKYHPDCLSVPFTMDFKRWRIPGRPETDDLQIAAAHCMKLTEGMEIFKNPRVTAKISPQAFVYFVKWYRMYQNYLS